MISKSNIQLLLIAFTAQKNKISIITEQNVEPQKTNNEMDNPLPPCPDALMCPISRGRMVNPVLASDGFTYERMAIEEWLGNGKRTSPITRKEMNTTLTPNQAMKTRIQEWVEENTGLVGLQKQLKQLQGPLFLASTPKEALDAIVVISELVTRTKLSNICILGPKGVEKMRRILGTEGNLST